MTRTHPPQKSHTHAQNISDRRSVTNMELPTVQELITNNGLSETQLSKKIPKMLLALIAMSISGWREIAPLLNLEDTEREDIESGKTPREQRLKMLEKWEEKHGNDATFFNLIEKFLIAKRRDLADKVCDVFKYQGTIYYASQKNALK